MNTVVVRCTACRELSRVLSEAVGLEVACPRCGVAFVARPEVPAEEPPVVRRAASSGVPVVRPPAPAPTPIRWDLAEQPDPPEVERIPPTGGLIALALLPFSIPLFWLLASSVTQREVVWSFAVPVALAVGVSGLGFGTAYVNRWSVAARAKALLALLLLAYLAAGFLFAVRKEWLQDLRRNFNRGHLNWATFHAEPPDEKAEPGKPKEPKLIGFYCKYPQGMAEVEIASPFPDWKSKAYGFRDPKRPATEEYTAAVARVPGVRPASAEWVAAVGKAVRAATPPDALVTESALEPRRDPLTKERWDCWQYHVTRPNDVWSRVARVYRVRGHAIYLAVEGPHLTPDAADVVFFLESLRGAVE